MTIAVDLRRKATKQTKNKQISHNTKSSDACWCNKEVSMVCVFVQEESHIGPDKEFLFA